MLILQGVWLLCARVSASGRAFAERDCLEVLALDLQPGSSESDQVVGGVASGACPGSRYSFGPRPDAVAVSFSKSQSYRDEHDLRDTLHTGHSHSRLSVTSTGVAAGNRQRSGSELPEGHSNLYRLSATPIDQQLAPAAS